MVTYTSSFRIYISFIINKDMALNDHKLCPCAVKP